MCVPGVQACATAGVRTSASNTARAMAPAETARGEARVIPPRLDPDPLALPANRFPKIVQLVFHHVVDRIASGIHVIAHLLDYVVYRNPVDQVLTALNSRSESTLRARRRPPRTFDGSASSPARAFESATSGPFCSFEAGQPGERGSPSRVPHQGTYRTAARRPATQQQGDSRADSGADQCCRQQVVLLLTLLVQFRFWV